MDNNKEQVGDFNSEIASYFTELNLLQSKMPRQNLRSNSAAYRMRQTSSQFAEDTQTVLMYFNQNAKNIKADYDLELKSFMDDEFTGLVEALRYSLAVQI